MPRLSTCLTPLIAAAIFVGCGSAPPKEPPAPKRSLAVADVSGKNWQWLGNVTSQGITDVKQPQRYTLTLQAGGRAEIQADCNRGGGNYKIADGTLSFSPMMSTRAACPADSQDDAFVSTLMKTVTFYLESGELNLVNTTGGVMRFKQAAAAAPAK